MGSAGDLEKHSTGLQGRGGFGSTEDRAAIWPKPVSGRYCGHPTFYGPVLWECHEQNWNCYGGHLIRPYDPYKDSLVITPSEKGGLYPVCPVLANCPSVH